MTKCPSCNIKLKKTTKYCPYCGSETVTEEKEKKKLPIKKIILILLIIFLIAYGIFYYISEINPQRKFNRMIKVLENEGFKLDNNISYGNHYVKENLKVSGFSWQVSLTVYLDGNYEGYYLNYSTGNRDGHGIMVGTYTENEGHVSHVMGECLYYTEGRDINLGEDVHSYEENTNPICERLEDEVNEYKEYYESLFEKADLKLEWFYD